MESCIKTTEGPSSVVVESKPVEDIEDSKRNDGGKGMESGYVR